MRRLATVIAAVTCLVACNKNKGGNAGGTAAPASGGSVKLAYLDPKCDPSSEDCKCNGTLEDPQGLKDLGLSDADVKAGVICLMGDFDGNGTKDVAIAGKGYDCDQDKPATVRMLMTDHDKITHAETLESLGCIAPYGLQKDEYQGVGNDRDAIEGTTKDGVDKVFYWNGTNISSEEQAEGD